jgi:hypothetical protein
MKKQDLIGFWTLASWTRLTRDGDEAPEFAEPIEGFLLYGEDGHMAVSIFAREKPQLVTSYGGRYELLGDEVIHYPLAGNSPHGIHGAKRRRVSMDGSSLRLETDWLDEAGPTYKFRLQWSKNT